MLLDLHFLAVHDYIFNVLITVYIFHSSVEFMESLTINLLCQILDIGEWFYQLHLKAFAILDPLLQNAAYPYPTTDHYPLFLPSPPPRPHPPPRLSLLNKWLDWVLYLILTIKPTFLTWLWRQWEKENNKQRKDPTTCFNWLLDLNHGWQNALQSWPPRESICVCMYMCVCISTHMYVGVCVCMYVLCVSVYIQLWYQLRLIG